MEACFVLYLIANKKYHCLDILKWKSLLRSMESATYGVYFQDLNSLSLKVEHAYLAELVLSNCFCCASGSLP